MPEEIIEDKELLTKEKALDELITKAFEEIAEKEYQEFLKQEKEWEKHPYKFSERHERIMKQMFCDYARGINIEKKYGKKRER